MICINLESGVQHLPEPATEDKQHLLQRLCLNSHCVYNKRKVIAQNLMTTYASDTKAAATSDSTPKHAILLAKLSVHVYSNFCTHTTVSHDASLLKRDLQMHAQDSMS